MRTEQPGPNRRGTKREVDVTVASQRRRAIINAAKACISEEGVDKLTLRKVAERAHVSHATIAYYFNSRRELIDSAFVAMSEEFMVNLRQRHLVYGTDDLVGLTNSFLDPENGSARFVVQMIDGGLHDPDLRYPHDEFISYGRERIEKSIAAGIEAGELRDDLDPELAAAFFHTILVWWQSELVAGMASRDKALAVGNLALELLRAKPQGSGVPPSPAGRSRSRNGHSPATAAVPATRELIETSLLNDPQLSSKAATTLAETFARLYDLAIDASTSEAG